MNEQPWRLSDRFDPTALPIADRHYNRQKPGTPQFVPPGRCLVLLADGPALWVSSWPKVEFTHHEWAGAWMNTLFRREGGDVEASDLILAAVAATRWKWGEPPTLGMVTFVDTEKIRRKRDPGRCYRRAGFRVVGETKIHKLLALQMLPEHMPEPCPPINGQLTLGLSA